jgi:hypothetical protein
MILAGAGDWSNIDIMWCWAMLFKRDLERPVEFTGQRFIAIVVEPLSCSIPLWNIIHLWKRLVPSLVCRTTVKHETQVHVWLLFYEQGLFQFV